MLFVPPAIPFMAPEAEAHYSSPGHTHSNPSGQLTIEYLSISEWIPPSHIGGEHKVQYIVAGYLPAYANNTTITKEIIKPDGTMGATDHASFGVPQGEVWYQTMGYVLDPFNASGWTMKVCAPEFDQCAERNFTISFDFLNVPSSPPTLTASAFLYSTSPTGGTMNIDVERPLNFAWFYNTSIQDPNGSTIPSFFPSVLPSVPDKHLLGLSVY